jgi:pilus assembly protein Flp/PilA
MKAVRRACRVLFRLKKAEDGATAIEYALIAVGIAIAVVATVNGVGLSLKTNFYDKVNNATAN